MNKVMQQPVTEILELIKTVNQDIEAIKTRLEKGIEGDEQILLNYKIWQQAITIRNDAIQILEQKVCDEISLKGLLAYIN